MEIEHAKDLLSNAVISLYARFKTKELTDDDLIDEPANAMSDRSWMAHAHATKACQQPDAEVFSRFRAAMGTILDIGAHWGYTALAMRQFGTDCPIVSIEAAKQNVECLDEFRKLDGNYDFTITALGDEDSAHNLYTPVVNGWPITGLNCLDGLVFSDSHGKLIASLVGQYIDPVESYDVKFIKTPLNVRKLDDVLASAKLKVPLSPIAAIKIDVEAFEAKVLRGAEKTLNKYRPFLMLEGANRDKDVAEILGTQGYVYGDIAGSQVRLTTERSTACNGCYLHLGQMDAYRSIGLLTN